MTAPVGLGHDHANDIPSDRIKKPFGEEAFLLETIDLWEDLLIELLLRFPHQMVPVLKSVRKLVRETHCERVLRAKFRILRLWG
jgi:hypothetical protein